MKMLGIIPSRYESNRFPGKPLIDIAGKTMIRRVYEAADQSGLLDELVVATDDQRIFNEVRSFGGNVLMTSTEHRNGTERCGEVLEQIPDFDVVINIQGDEPLLKSEHLKLITNLFEDPEVQIGTLVKKFEKASDIQNPNRVKVVLNNKKDGIYFSRAPLPFLANVPVDEWLDHGSFYKHIGIYAWRSQTLKKLLKLQPTELEKQESLEQLRWLYHGYKIRTAETSIETPNIDVPEDLEKVLKIVKL